MNTTENNLLYWGLDYPPLTAYHSYLTGLLARAVDSKYVELFTSRGYESLSHQFFMRMSVLVSDCLIYTSALYYYAKSLKISDNQKWVVFALCSHPGITLIDYGHFQYNCVSLGLALWAFQFLSQSHHILAAIAFTAALNFKQMELYHAIPVFFYLLAKCQPKGSTVLSQIANVLKLGTVTLICFAILWYPFLEFRNGLFLQVLRRVFPLDRGLFEDYVANFWCTFNVIVKVKRLMEPASMARCCLVVTALFSLPCGLQLYFKSSYRNFLLCLINVSMAFFLFSYHVHEKSILLVALPVSLVSPYLPLASFWFLSIAHFSMLPLYLKDDLMIPAIALLGLYVLFAHSCIETSSIPNLLQLLGICSAVGSIVVGTLFLVCPSPQTYPYFWTLLVSVWSFVHYVGFFLYFLWLQFSVGADSLTLKVN